LDSFADESDMCIDNGIVFSNDADIKISLSRMHCLLCLSHILLNTKEALLTLSREIFERLLFYKRSLDFWMPTEEAESSRYYGI